MSESAGNGDTPAPGDNLPEPIHGQVRLSNVSARIPEEVGAGVLSNNVLILTGPHECVLDFVLRFGEPQRVVTRVILPPPVARQFVAALQENIRNFELRFGTMPRVPRPRTDGPTAPGASSGPGETTALGVSVGIASGQAPPPESARPVSEPSIQDIYDELRLPDGMLAGRYANTVLIRHSPTEFCFDFIANIFPRSAVSSRVFMAAPHVKSLLESLMRSLSPPPPPADPAYS